MRRAPAAGKKITKRSDGLNEGDLLLALDIGTSSVRAMLYDAATAEAIPDAFVQVKHTPITTPDGGALLDAGALATETLSCIESVLPRAQNRKIAGVGVSTFWHSFVGVDETGAAQTPVVLWNDHRARAQAEALRHELNADDYTQRTGCPIHTSYLPARLRWLAETNRDLFDKCARFVSPGEFLMGYLFGIDNVTCSISMASGTGLLNQAKGEWDKDVLSHLPGMAVKKLSPIGDEPVRAELREPYKARLAALNGVPWFPSLGDGACSNIGCGALRPDTLALMIGTSGAIRVVTPPGEQGTPPPVPPGLWRYQIEKDRYLLGGALSNGGSVWAWCKNTFRVPQDDDTLEHLLAAIAPDSHGLTVLPFLAGERAPLWRDDLRGVLYGQGSGTTPEHIVRAHLEAVALRFSDVRNALYPVAPKGASLIGTGGGLSASPLWAQIIADALGEPIHLSSEEEASSRGAILHVREKLGGGSIDAAPPVSVTRTLMPRPDSTAIYHKARDRQNELLKKVLG